MDLSYALHRRVEAKISEKIRWIAKMRIQYWKLDGNIPYNS